MRKCIHLIAVALFLSLSCFGGGFQLNLQGVRQMAMGGSGSAFPWDASCIFYNPASLSRLGGLQAYGNLFLVSPHVRYLQTPTGGYYSDTKTHMATPFAAYAGGNIAKNSQWAAGIGIYTPFGNTLKWEDNWTGRYMVQSITLSSVFIQPTISYALNDAIAIGAGFVYAMGNVDISKAIPIQNLQAQDGQADLSGKASGIGFNAGIHIKASEKLQFGLNYRSAVNMNVKKGTASFSTASTVATEFPTTTFSSSLPLPAVLTGGAGFQIGKAFRLQADLVYAFWGTYDSLRIDFSEQTQLLQNISDPRSYKNTLAFRVGGHYTFHDKLEVMLGCAYDPTPSQDHLVSPDAVDANRLTLSCGAGYNLGRNLNIMAGLSYTTTPVRNIRYEPANFEGAFKINSFSPALGIAYRF